MEGGDTGCCQNTGPKPRTTGDASEAVRFHPVRVRAVERQSNGSADRIELVPSSGRSIRVPYGFDAETCGVLLAVAEASA